MIWLVTIDGGDDQPERSCQMTFEADTAEAASALAEEHNPGLTVSAVAQPD